MSAQAAIEAGLRAARWRVSSWVSPSLRALVGTVDAEPVVLCRYMGRQQFSDMWPVVAVTMILSQQTARYASGLGVQEAEDRLRETLRTIPSVLDELLPSIVSYDETIGGRSQPYVTVTVQVVVADG